MKIGFISKDLSIAQSFQQEQDLENIGVFESLLELLDNISSLDNTIVLITHNLVQPSEFSNLTSLGATVLYKSVNQVDFYTTKNNLNNNKVHILPFSMTYSNILDFIQTNVLGNTKYKKTNVICFSGAARGVGCTSISSMVSRIIAEDQSIKVLHISLDGTLGTEYLIEDSNVVGGLDTIKSKLVSGVLSVHEVIDACTKLSDNFYVLAGTNRVPFVNQYTPDHIEQLLDIISPEFDVVICDVGSQYTLGMAIGVLNYTPHRFIVMSQSPVSIRRFNENKNQLLNVIGIKDFYLILNKYINADNLASRNDIKKVLGYSDITAIPNIENSIYCEINSMTLRELDYDKTLEINKVVSLISELIGKTINISNVKKKRFGIF